FSARPPVRWRSPQPDTPDRLPHDVARRSVVVVRPEAMHTTPHRVACPDNTLPDGSRRRHRRKATYRPASELLPGNYLQYPATDFATDVAPPAVRVSIKSPPSPALPGKDDFPAETPVAPLKSG